MKTWIYASAALLGLTACSSWNSGTQLKSGALADTPYVAATADLRFVLARPKSMLQGASGASAGTAVDRDLPDADPLYTVCAEPSPDIAKALSDAITASVNATASGLKALGGSGASASLTPSVTASQNAAIAEIGRRLATTQLLRDGVYRLCEAFANGAISREEYALVLSRYGDTMVTLLAIEGLTGMADTQTAASATSNASVPAPASDANKGDATGGTQNTDKSKTGAQGGNQQTSLRAGRPGFVRTAAEMPAATPAQPGAGTAAAPANAGAQPSHTGNGQVHNNNHAQAATATPASAASEPKTGSASSDKAAIADAVIKLQQNYLQQSAYAPLIVLCTYELAWASDPSRTQKPNDDIVKDCNAILLSTVQIASTSLHKAATATGASAAH